ncbi:Putative multidrug resistance protein MdtD [uncultured archaeon]|nr:Putative multidrug resistance protein MdtD [uncultured archaeon]
MAMDQKDSAAENGKGDNLRWWVLLTVIIGTFLGRLDQTIVSLATPSIIQDFSITVSEAAWISTAYILANAIFVPVWGKLGDTSGRKKVYILGFVGFIIGSMLAGLAWDLNSMILFRVIQAIAGSADYPTAMAIIAVTFKAGKERAQALGLWSTSFAAASVFGPLLGGPLIDLFGWRSVFLINIPIGIIGLAMAMFFVKESVSDKRTVKFDWPGAITLGIALSSLVLVLDKGLDWGWLSGVSIMMYIIVALFGLIFIRIETRHDEPIIDLGFFRNPAFVGAIVNNFIVFMGLIGGIFLVPVFAQTFLGYDATSTGLIFIPMTFSLFIAAQIGSRLDNIDAGRVIAISTLIAAIGMFSFVFFIDARSTALDVILPLSLMAFGIGLAMSQRTNIIASTVPENEIGSASSALALVRNISGAFGIALFATILQDSTESHVLALARESVVNSAGQLAYAQASTLIILKAQVLAYHDVFIASAAILFIGAILAFFIKPGTAAKPNTGVFAEA